MPLMDFFHISFIQKAIIAGILASISCGIMGPLVVANRMVLITGGISHAAYGGVGIAIFLGLPIFGTTLIYSLFISLIIALMTIKDSSNTEMIIALIWSAGMSLGIILMDLSPGYNTDIMSYLFGSLIVLSNFDILIALIVTLCIIITIILFYNQFIIFIYDKDFAIVSGINIILIHFIFNILIACSIVMLIRIVGLILVMAMLTIPVYLSNILFKSFIKIIIFSALFNIFFIILGLYLSYLLNLSSGATIIAVSTVFLFIILIVRLTAKVNENK